MFFQCQYCKHTLTFQPLCDLCLSRIRIKAEQTTFPSPIPEADLCHALYRLNATNYPLLKKWKTKGGSQFYRKIVNPQENALIRITEKYDYIVPIPDDPTRNWERKWSPVETYARTLSRQLKTPILRCLVRNQDHTQPGQKSKKQAFGSAEDRRWIEKQYKATKRLKNKRILLVDDFVVTGHTVKFNIRKLGLQSRNVFDLACIGIQLTHPRI